MGIGGYGIKFEGLVSQIVIAYIWALRLFLNGMDYFYRLTFQMVAFYSMLS